MIATYSGDGMWWLRLGSVVLVLRSPRNRPLFSERNGYDPPALSWRGWRLHVRGPKS